MVFLQKIDLIGYGENIYMISIGKDRKFMKDNNVYCINRNFILR